MKQKHINRQKVLAAKWPHLFSFPVPLKIGIHKDYPTGEDRPMRKKDFTAFLFSWVREPEYIEAIRRGKGRYGFDGSLHPMWLDDERHGGGR